MSDQEKSEFDKVVENYCQRVAMLDAVLYGDGTIEWPINRAKEVEKELRKRMRIREEPNESID